MKRRVELVYDADCPNVALARSALLRASAQLGVPARWSEWERHDPDAPDYVRACGSPAVLVDGRDVVPSPSAQEDCCRLYETERGPLSGAPSANVIAAALGRGDRESRWPVLAGVLPSALAAVLPSCPFCWPLYAGTLSAFGLGFMLDERHMPSLAGGLLLLALTSLGYKARLRHGYGPLAVGVIGAVAVLLPKFVWPSALALYVGLGSIIGASLWNVWPRGAPPKCSRSVQ